MSFGNRFPIHVHAGLTDKSVPPTLSQPDLSSLTPDVSPSSFSGVPQVPFVPMPLNSAGLVDASVSPNNSQMNAYPSQMGPMDTLLSPNNSQANFYPQEGVSAVPAEGQVPFMPMVQPEPVAVADPEKAQRGPVYIANQRSGGKMIRPGRSRTRRRVVVHAIVTVLLIMVVSGALAAVVPVGSGSAKGENRSLLSPLISMFASNNTSASLIAAQAATATAVTQDGYDAGNVVYAGVVSASDSQYSSQSSTTSSITTTSSGTTTSGTDVSPQDSGNLNRFFYGQCTYWANMRYHELTGHWIPWLGNAYEWASQASAYGWVTSGQPNPNGPSIIVLGPYVQSSGAYGHVAVVEQGTASATNGVLTSNWNYNGDWAKEDWVTFYSGPGVTFIWY